MKKIIFLISLVALSANSFYVHSDCFMVAEDNNLMISEGDVYARHAPESTFKIAISLMGYDAGFLIDEEQPELPFKEGYPDFLPVWKQNHNPAMWMKNSCIWYSQQITQTLGIEKFEEYLSTLNYGNRDASGDAGQNNGLTHSWLSSSLQISAAEQITFLKKLLAGNLPITPEAMAATKKLLFVEELADGWQLYGKTGTGNQIDENGVKNPDLRTGWYIGWIEKDDRKIVFARYIEDTQKEAVMPSVRAREDVRGRLKELQPFTTQ